MKNEFNKTLAKINPKENYNVSQMIKGKFFFWVSHAKSYRSIINYDHKTKNELKSEISGEGNGKRYSVKGQNIINFINKYGLGLGFKTLKK